MKTKSYLFAAASATLMLASCTQNEVVEMPATRAIGFGTYVGNTSRAVPETTVEFLQDAGNGFYVFGSYIDDASKEVVVFDGKTPGSHVTSSGSTGKPAWGYSPINYWSVGKDYKFVAYGPAKANGNGSASFTYADNTLSIAGFTANGDLDLVVAEGREGGYKLETPTSDSPVIDFKFFHALSKVRFTLVNGWRNLVILTVKDVKVSGLSKSATLKTPGTLANAANPATIEASNWTAYSDKDGAYEWTEEFVAEAYGVTSNDKIVDKTVTKDANIRYEYFMMPQTLTAEAVILTFKCQVVTDKGSNVLKDIPNYPLDAEGFATVTVKLPVNPVPAWLPGTAYNYTLTINGDIFGLKPIQFNKVDVTAWDTPTESNPKPENP